MKKQYDLCIVGCGSIARVHARILKKRCKDINVWFASRSKDKARSYSRKYGGKGFFGSYDEAFSHPQIDAVLLCTPHHLHFPDAMQALHSGKNVVVEKPIAISAAEAQQMIDLARLKGLHLLVAENHHFRPSVKYLRDIIERGDIGIPKWIRLNVMYKRNLRPHEWRSHLDYMGGGALIDGGIHWVNQLYEFGGGGVEHLFAQRAKKTELDIPLEDTMVIMCKCQNGAIGAITYSWGIRSNRAWQTCGIHGSEGSLFTFNHGLLAWTQGKKRSFQLLSVRDWRGFHAMWDSFRRTLLFGDPSPMTGEKGLRDLIFVKEAYFSAAKNGVRYDLSPQSISLREKATGTIR